MSEVREPMTGMMDRRPCGGLERRPGLGRLDVGDDGKRSTK